MKTVEIKKGLNVPISGEPLQEVRTAAKEIETIGLVGDDYIGLRPTMFVKVGDRVKAGQLLFSDKKNPGINFTAPGSGEIVQINRGEKRKFESLVIQRDGNEKEQFLDPGLQYQSLSGDQLKDIILKAGLWHCFRTRPFGKTPGAENTPASLFITASESAPLAPSPKVIIDQYQEEFSAGLNVVQKLFNVDIHLCISNGEEIPCPEETEKLHLWNFNGPHPAGLASTHIHMIDPVAENYVVWHISYHDVIGLGHLFLHGTVLTEKIISVAGPSIKEPCLMKVPVGADMEALCSDMLIDGEHRILSGSVLDGRISTPFHKYLGRYHSQVSVLEDSSGRSLFNWMTLGTEKFSISRAFGSAWRKGVRYAMPTAKWGGDRALYPLRTYEHVMPLDIIATPFLKSIAVCDTEKAKKLGALELIEEDLALCSYVCPGKIDFGPMLRDVLTSIEEDG